MQYLLFKFQNNDNFKLINKPYKFLKIWKINILPQFVLEDHGEAENLF